MLGHLTQKLGSRTTTLQSCRFLRARWERGYLKDLYHRRQLLGADPVISRSAYPNWDYPSEVFAFAHRIGAPEVGSDALVKALTTASYLERADVDGGAEGGMPSGKEEYEYECNTELVQKGKRILDNLMKAFLRFNLQNAPEELIEAVNAQMTSDDLLANIGFHIGIEVIIRTGEHPPAASSVADALRALLGVIGEQRAQRLIIDLIVPQLIDVDFADAYPLNDPLAVLSDLLKRKGASELEPRLLRSMGEVSAQPVFVVGIYKDKQELVGQSAGESIEAAVDLAAREGLLRLWGLTSDKVFFFGNKAYNAPLKTYSKENFRLNDVCSKGTDLSVQSVIHLDPMNIVEVALRYKNEVEAVVGKSYTKRLRHKFSRGSLAKRSFRYLVKPKVYTVA